MEGVRYLHFGTEWVQGAMRLRKPDAIELEYAQQMMAWLLFLSPSAPDFHVAQLGLGAAALTKFSTGIRARARDGGGAESGGDHRWAQHVRPARRRRAPQRA